MLPSISAVSNRVKRQRAVVEYSEHPAFKASLWLSNRRNVPMPAPPNPDNMCTNKRQWEAEFEQWRDALRQDLRIADDLVQRIAYHAARSGAMEFAKQHQNKKTYEVVQQVVQPSTAGKRCRFVELPEMRSNIGRPESPNSRGLHQDQMIATKSTQATSANLQ